MATRVVSGTIYHLGTNTPWSGLTIRFETLGEIIFGGKVYPPDFVTAVTDSTGAFSVTLAVPDTGTAPYMITYPGRQPIVANLGSGAPTTLDALAVL